MKEIYKTMAKITSMQEIETALYIIDIADNGACNGIVEIEEFYGTERVRPDGDYTVIQTNCGSYSYKFLRGDGYNTDFRIISKETHPEFFL